MIVILLKLGLWYLFCVWTHRFFIVFPHGWPGHHRRCATIPAGTAPSSVAKKRRRKKETWVVFWINGLVDSWSLSDQIWMNGTSWKHGTSTWVYVFQCNIQATYRLHRGLDFQTPNASLGLFLHCHLGIRTEDWSIESWVCSFRGPIELPSGKPTKSYWNGPVEIVDPLKIVIFHSYVNVYQSVAGIALNLESLQPQTS